MPYILTPNVVRMNLVHPPASALICHNTHHIKAETTLVADRLGPGDNCEPVDIGGWQVAIDQP